MAESLSNSSLSRIRQLAEERRWPQVAALADDLDARALVAHPEIAVYLADSFWRTGHPERTLELGWQTMSALRQRNSPALLLNLTNIIGIAQFELGQTAEAAETFSHLLELANEAEDSEYSARASNNLGVIATVQDRHEHAVLYYQRALTAYHRLGHVRGIAQTHYNLGVNFRELGFYDEAETHYRSAVEYADRAGSEDVIALAESDRGLLRVQMGDRKMGRVLAGRARDRFEAMADPVRRGEALRVLGIAAREDGDVEEALRHLREALDAARTHGNRLLRAEVQREIGSVLWERRDRAGAREAWEDALDQYTALGASSDAAEVSALLGEL